MDIYENVIIGNFLVGLGHEIGRTDAELPFSVNLLQQTPADKAVGDVLFDSVDFVKIIEFKRTKNNSHKELDKHDFLSRALHLPKNQHLLSVSREIHWYIETENLDGNLITKFAPYLDFTTELKEGDLSNLISQSAHELTGQVPPAHSTDEYAAYLNLLKTMNGKRSASTGALVFWATSGGGLRYVPVAELEHIRLTLKDIYQEIDQKYEREMQLEKSLSYAREQNLELEKEIERSRNQSRSRGYGMTR